MGGSLAIWSAFLATVFSILVNGEETGVLQNEVYKKEGREDWVDAQLLPARETLQREVEREGAMSSSGDNFSELPRVAFLSKPQDPVTPKKEGNGRKRRKGKGRKRDPCLRKYRDYCFHGECKYIKALKAPSCICHSGYHGERCHALSLPVEKHRHSYDHTTILAVTAVVLSSLCLIIIAALLMLRCHKQGVYDVESEEKVKLGNTSNH
ncbi:proheparin-binding EGF-like growth factor [Anolis carolinensis]|uniref:Proheparin-binding EGF-like growth factor n=1 Tax=Anolis carolinensis TaxID=28377 RepID=A0A803SZA9_ANOCA|nr:PREDICTED: proheparin-binding EGF-like growth factor [Anolis carolinensis]|eukprot:XP_008107243.1 PREDICTED: proheparin-binding EGF-like growth factor [Anolis carolinensis]